MSNTASRAASLPTPKAASNGGGGAASAAGKRTPVASFKLESSHAASNSDKNALLTTPGGGVKACYQCGATKTPQWREGPEGEKEKGEEREREILLSEKKPKN